MSRYAIGLLDEHEGLAEGSGWLDGRLVDYAVPTTAGGRGPGVSVDGVRALSGGAGPPVFGRAVDPHRFGEAGPFGTRERPLDARGRQQ